MEYEILDHTADLCIRTYGRSLSELFRNASHALMDMIVDRSSVRSTLEIPYEINGDTKEELLIKLLGEIIYLNQGEHLVFNDLSIRNKTENSISGILYAEQYDSNRHELETDIKAATYHNLKIEKVNNNFKADIVFDI